MLSEVDKAFLEQRGFDHEVIGEGQMVSLIIHGFRMPDGYVPGVVDLLLRLPSGFPDAAPDMWWTAPAVSYVGGSAPPATEVRQEFVGRTWQRWSRHLAVSWRPGIDNLQTYLRLIRTDLERATMQVAA
ncbi:MAG: E2/UBC family protein [Solirubrobacterales bacterium]